ncbi:MAG: patatin-like phospholipase family protein [Eubacterium sp.]|nr:patatin-like phospholipase family protein [Eubacterium sp.]
MEGTGLILAGGGGKGIYQVGILKSLAEAGYLDDVVAVSGASIGSVNACLFADGVAEEGPKHAIEQMEKVWNEIDYSVFFDTDPYSLKVGDSHFSRKATEKLIDKYLDYNLFGSSVNNKTDSIEKNTSDPMLDFREVADETEVSATDNFKESDINDFKESDSNSELKKSLATDNKIMSNQSADTNDIQIIESDDDYIDEALRRSAITLNSIPDQPFIKDAIYLDIDSSKRRPSESIALDIKADDKSGIINILSSDDNTENKEIEINENNDNTDNQFTEVSNDTDNQFTEVSDQTSDFHLTESIDELIKKSEENINDSKCMPVYVTCAKCPPGFVTYEQISESELRLITSGSTEETYRNFSVEYMKLNNQSPAYIKSAILATTALPVVYSPVRLNGNLYVDGGVKDNVPIKPLYDMGIRKFIVIELTQTSGIKNREQYADAEIIDILPSKDLGSLLNGTMNFDREDIRFKKMLGELDGKRFIKTLFEKDQSYIAVESALAEMDFQQAKKNIQFERHYDTLSKSANRNFDYIKKLEEDLKKYGFD